jgi:hypothetical protein
LARDPRINPEAPFDGGRPDRRWLDPLPPPQDDRAWLKTILLVFGFALIFFGLLVYAFAAQAHDHKRPDLNKWFETRTNVQGNRCCDGSEAKLLANVDWQSACSFEVQEGKTERVCHYQVFIAGRWWDVPNTALVTGPNLDGETLVWPTYYWIDGIPDHGISSISIQCFMPGAGG